MSRAFVKESDGEELLGNRPQRRHSGLPNYITPAGETALRARVDALSAEREALVAHPDALGGKNALALIDEEIAYLRERIDRAIVVPRPVSPCQEVTLGTRVNIVGEDEIDVAARRISWCSPLGRAVMQHAVGDVVVWQRPVGNLEMEILSIDVPE